MSSAERRKISCKIWYLISRTVSETTRIAATTMIARLASSRITQRIWSCIQKSAAESGEQCLQRGSGRPRKCHSACTAYTPPCLPSADLALFVFGLHTAEAVKSLPRKREIYLRRANVAKLDVDAQFVRRFLNRLDYLLVRHALEFRLMAGFKSLKDAARCRNRRRGSSLGFRCARRAGVWLCEYPGLSFQRSPVCACSLVSSLLLSGATMSQQSSLTQVCRVSEQEAQSTSGVTVTLPIAARAHEPRLGGSFRL